MSRSSCSILYTIFAWFLGMCYGFVLLSSAAGQHGEIEFFKNGQSLIYQWKTTTLLSEKGANKTNVGFSMTGNVIVQVLWSDGERKLLKFQIESPKLLIRSRKSPSPEQFLPHSSILDGVSNKPFLVIWENGKIENVLLAQNETLALVNIKKGITSLFQVQFLEGTVEETSASGKCLVSYSSVGSTELLKTITNCNSDDLDSFKENDPILGVKRTFASIVRYQRDATHFKSISSKELYSLALSVKEEIGSQIYVDNELTLVSSGNIDSIKEDSIENAIGKFESKEKITLVKETLLTRSENFGYEKSVDFTKSVKDLKDFLKTKELGTLRATKSFVKLINIAKKSNKEDIFKALSQKKNKDILPQLYDILGYVQTDDSHVAVLKAIYLDNEDHLDYNERYLWALSFSPWPNPNIVEDLLKKFVKNNNLSNKVKETLILTIASMTRKLGKLPYGNAKLAREVEETILNNLDYAKNDERYVYFRALKNLQSLRTIPTLLKYIQKGTQKEAVHAWKALRSFPSTSWNGNVLKAANKALFQLDRTYDSSSRALAIEILLDSIPSDNLLEDLMKFVASNNTAYEIRQYTFQKIKLKSEKDTAFGHRVQNIIKSNPRINNYSGLSPRGLSTALERRFLTSSSANGSLISLQEIKSGIVKRGIVSIDLEKDDINKEMFSLGITAGGLSSFVSSNDNEVGDQDEEAVTAGMELSIAGTQIRPFVFFSGQGELMGHVWSGTASEMTPAFQGLLLLQDHMEFVRLRSGFIVKFELRIAVSFDLSGKIEISLWNRNAESMIRNSAGILMSGTTGLDSSIIKSQVDFMGTTETVLNFQSDIDFSSNVKFCMRLSQPDAIFRHNVYKAERIPDTKYKLRISNYRVSQINGVTYSINRKNNEMCSLIFN